MRPRVRWLGATLKPAMLWPKPQLSLSTGSPPNLTGLKLSSTPEEQAQADTDGLPSARSGDILPTSLIQQKVMGWGVLLRLCLAIRELQYPRLGHPAHQY